MLTADWTWLS